MVIAIRALLRSTAGVRLAVAEEADGQGRTTVYTLSTHRPPQPRLFFNETEALAAFDAEAKASLMDPVVVKRLEWSMIGRAS